MHEAYKRYPKFNILGISIDQYLFNDGPNSNKYSERYMCNNIEYYQSPKIELREPTKEEKSLREKIKNKQAGAELCQAQGELKLVWLKLVF